MVMKRFGLYTYIGHITKSTGTLIAITSQEASLVQASRHVISEF